MSTIVTTHIRPHRIGRFELQRMVQEHRNVETWTGYQRFPGGVRRASLIHKWSGRADDHRAKFMLEAHLARLCDHPNVLRTIGVEASSVRLYYAVEQPKGATLGELLERDGSGMEPAIAIAIVRSVARAMVFFHHLETARGRRVGVCCRALSAEDVLLSSEGEVKIHPIRIRSSAAPSALKFGGGAKASSAEFGERRDVFLLGQMLMRLLLGSSESTLPLPFGTTSSSSNVALAVARVPRQYRSEVYRSLSWCLRALEDEACNYTVDVLLERLEQLPGGANELKRAVERWMPVRVEPIRSGEDRTALADGCRRTANA